MMGSPGVLILLGGFGVAGAGLRSFGGVLLVVGLTLLVLAAWTMPWATVIDADGVTIRTLARTRRIPWDDIVAFQRHRGRSGGPFVVRTVTRARYALATSTERPGQWDELNELVRAHAPGVSLPPAPPAHPFNRRPDADLHRGRRHGPGPGFGLGPPHGP